MDKIREIHEISIRDIKIPHNFYHISRFLDKKIQKSTKKYSQIRKKIQRR